MKKNSCFIYIITFIFLFAVHTSFAEEIKTTPEKKRDIKLLMEITNAAKLALQIMERTVELQKRISPKIPDTFWKEIKESIKVDELIDLIIPIYDKYLTHEEIKYLIKFYQSPTGQKVIKITPALMQESMNAGQNWGRKIGAKIEKKMKEKGYRK